MADLPMRSGTECRKSSVTRERSQETCEVALLCREAVHRSPTDLARPRLRLELPEMAVHTSLHRPATPSVPRRHKTYQ